MPFAFGFCYRPFHLAFCDFCKSTCSASKQQFLRRKGRFIIFDFLKCRVFDGLVGGWVKRNNRKTEFKFSFLMKPQLTHFELLNMLECLNNYTNRYASKCRLRSSIVDKQVEFLLQFELNVQAAKSLDLI